MTDPRTDAKIAIEGVRSRKMAVDPVPRPEAPPPVNDHRERGPAALARPQSFEQVATGNARQGREKADTVRYHDAHPWDHYERGALLTDRQIDAGWALTKLYQSGFTPMLALPSYGGSGAGPMSDEEDAERSVARREYARLADLIPHTARHAMACMVRGEFPTMSNRITLLKSACDVIADDLEIPRDGI